MGKKDKFVSILNDLQKTGGISRSAIVSRDGLMIASDLGDGTDTETFAAMTAAMLGAAETSASELNLGELSSIIIDSSRGKVVSAGAGETAFVVVLSEPDANLGLIIISIGKVCSKIACLLKEKPSAKNCKKKR